eukprot:Skav211254  [mRNA]  locus=scaffold3676:91471:93361:+ [translate_table: standard]
MALRGQILFPEAPSRPWHGRVGCVATFRCSNKFQINKAQRDPRGASHFVWRMSAETEAPRCRTKIRLGDLRKFRLHFAAGCSTGQMLQSRSQAGR